MPRSGTSLLGRNIARLENCTGLQNTGVYEDEGRYLQDVYLTESDCGGAGRFGFDPRIHLTEESPLLTPQNIAKLRSSWHTYWDNSKNIFVEKTPANLLMTRFLQAAFPNSLFVVIKRHPIPVSLAIQKWKVNVTSLYRLFEHWLHCHHLYEQDRKHLKQVYELSYEDYVRNQDKFHQEIAEFIGTRVSSTSTGDNFRTVAQWRNPTGLRVPEQSMEITSDKYDQKYFDRWRRLLTASPFAPYYRHIAKIYEPRFARHGYSLAQGLEGQAELLSGSGKAMRLLGPCYCYGADASAFVRRAAARSLWWARRSLRAALPKGIRARLKGTRNKCYPGKPAVEVVTR